MLPDYEKFLIDFYPERDAMQIDPLIAKIEQLSIDLETVQCQLEDAAVTHDEIVHNAVVRGDYDDRLIRIETVWISWHKKEIHFIRRCSYSHIIINIFHPVFVVQA